MKYTNLILILLALDRLSAQAIDSSAIKQVDSLIRVSRDYTSKRDFDKALEVISEAERIALKNLGRESASYGSCAFNRGRVMHNKKDFPEAEKFYIEAKVIREKVLGKAHPAYGWAMNNLGLLNKDMGNYDKAESYYLEAKAIWEKALGKEHFNYAASINNLASLYWTLGDYEKAEPLYLESKTIRKKVLGNEHPDYAASLNNLASLYIEMGNYLKVEPLILEAKAILEKVFGKEHFEYAKSLEYLAIFYHDMGNFKKAEPLYIEAKDIREKVFGKEHSEYASSINNLAVLYDDMGNYEKAEPLYLEFKAIIEKTLGKEHPDYATSPNNLGNLYYEMGSYEKAVALHLEAKAIREKMLGKAHPDYTASLDNLARVYERQHRYLASEPLLEEAFFLRQTRFLNATSFLSEQELAQYLIKYQKGGDRLNSYLFARPNIKAHSGILTNLAYNYALFYKGFLQAAATRLNAPAFISAEMVDLNLQLKSYRRRLSVEYTKPIAGQKGIAELEEKANLVEKKLARSVSGYAEAIRQVKWQDVKDGLKKAEAAIEIVHFKINFPSYMDSIMYAALLIEPGSDQPKFIPLFEEKSLDSLLYSKSERRADYVNSLYTLSDRGAVAIDAPKKLLYDILWKPLENELREIKTIYFSPSGLLHRINLNAIPVSETEVLADRYQLVELNSTRQLVIPNQIKHINNDAVLFGGIQFERDTNFISNEPLIVSRSRGELSFQNIDTTLRGGSWNYLSGTEREVNAIETIMQHSGVKTNLKKGLNATEEAFKNIGINNAPSPRILHIATHGYFFPDQKNNSQHSAVSSQKESVFKISDHPMLRSGLIMAGGNAAWQGKQPLEGREDGILTAYEISQMNLSNTELVVLSACETGLGDIQGNEGVYGLQRAFKIAGAKYLIMSLWQVPDKQTSLLMTAFYKKWLENKMSIPDAFHAAQKELRDLGLDPYQWAGFVLVE